MYIYDVLCSSQCVPLFVFVLDRRFCIFIVHYRYMTFSIYRQYLSDNNPAMDFSDRYIHYSRYLKLCSALKGYEYVKKAGYTKAS